MKYSVSVVADGKTHFFYVEGETSYECLTKLKQMLKESYHKGIVESMILVK